MEHEEDIVVAPTQQEEQKVESLEVAIKNVLRKAQAVNGKFDPPWFELIPGSSSLWHIRTDSFSTLSAKRWVSIDDITNLYFFET